MFSSTLDTNLNNSYPSPFVVDSTLRDGEQTPGIVFSLEEKSILLSRLIDIGVREFEVGIPAMGDDNRRDVSILQRLGNRRGARMLCWSRCHLSDIESCAGVGASAIHISLPVSDLQMGIIGLNRTMLLDRLCSSLVFCRGLFDFVSVGAQDATRADSAFLMQYLDTAAQMGANRIRIADTVGCGNPLEINSLFQELRRRFPSVELEFHAHNDFGMATANALCALQGGANGISTTLLGIGERAGNASFETVVVAAKEVLGINFGVNTKGIYPLCRYFARTMNRDIAPSHPIVGEKVLTHESGIHTHGQLAHPRAFQPIEATSVGRTQPPFVFGSHTGRAAVKRVLEKNGQNARIDTLTDIVTRRIKYNARNGVPSMSEQDVVALAEELGRKRA